MLYFIQTIRFIIHCIHTYIHIYAHFNSWKAICKIISHYIHYIVYNSVISSSLYTCYSDSLGPEVWEKFMDDMVPCSCAYALFDFNFLAKDGRKIQKLAFIFM